MVAVRRRILLECFVVMCSIDRPIISLLLSSVLPLEVAQVNIIYKKYVLDVCSCIHCKKGYRFSRPHARESLFIDMPARDGKIDNLFYSVSTFFYVMLENWFGEFSYLW
jgi:hypothetical protein